MKVRSTIHTHEMAFTPPIVFLPHPKDAEWDNAIRTAAEQWRDERRRRNLPIDTDIEVDVITTLPGPHQPMLAYRLEIRAEDRPR